MVRVWSRSAVRSDGRGLWRRGARVSIYACMCGSGRADVVFLDRGRRPFVSRGFPGARPAVYVTSKPAEAAQQGPPANRDKYQMPPKG